MPNISEEELQALLKSNPDLKVAEGLYSGMKTPGKGNVHGRGVKGSGGASSLPEMALSKGAAVGKKQKYNAQPTEFLGRRYASKKEAKYAEGLELRRKSGGIMFWLRQVPFDLPGGARYLLDFMYLYRVHGSLDETKTTLGVAFVEVKGRDLPMGKLKRKQVEEIYHIKIEVV